MMRIRRMLYRAGLRPRPGSIWFSPSLAWVYAWRDAGGLSIAIEDSFGREREDDA